MRAREETARLLLAHRRTLHAYLYAIVRDPHLAEDLFQEVSLILLRRLDEEGPPGNFWAFAREVARREALAALRRTARAPRPLSPEALQALDRGFEETGTLQDPARLEALRRCVQALPRLWQNIVEHRYWKNRPVPQVAAALLKSENTVAVTLHRIRLRLAECVRARLRGMEHGPAGA
jgi:RNA polymerase sigma-70 factor (ECF subfamily)